MNLRHFLFSIVLTVTLIIDQITKYLIRTSLSVNESRIVIQDIFSLTYLRNTGVSFGLLKGFNEIFLVISVAVLIFFLFVYFKNKNYEIQIALICAGTLGNLIDRLALGFVVDFFNFHVWPVFNIADASITIGMLWLIITLYKNDEDLF